MSHLLASGEKPEACIVEPCIHVSFIPSPSTSCISRGEFEHNGKTLNGHAQAYTIADLGEWMHVIEV